MNMLQTTAALFI